jgi:hypothetical protein
MQYDVKAVQVTVSGSAYADRTRVKGLTISFASGGTVTLRDDGAGGTIRFQYTAPAAAGTLHIPFPGEGILFSSAVYVALSGATAVVFYG